MGHTSTKIDTILMRTKSLQYDRGSGESSFRTRKIAAAACRCEPPPAFLKAAVID